ARVDRTQLRWAIAFLLGLATVTAAAFSWRAAQIGSTAAFDDRQSISETVRVAQGTVERTVAVAEDTRAYAGYRADYAVATALDSPAALDPDKWARHAETLRVRINGLVRWAFVVLVSVLLYAIAEISRRLRNAYAFTCAGLVVYITGLVGGFSAVFF